MNLTVEISFARRMKKVFARAIAGSMLLVLPACRIPSLRQAEPAPDIPAGFYRASNSEHSSPLAAVVGGVGFVNFTSGTINLDNSAQLRVDEFYNDTALTELICQSIAGNRELKILDQEVLIASNEIRAAQGAYLPFVTVGAGAGLEKPSLFTPAGAAEDQLLYPTGKHFPDPLGNFLGAFNFVWQLDIWRQLHNARDAAIQRYIAASEKRNYFLTRLVAEIAENYYALMALDQRIVTLDQTIHIQQQSLEIAISKMAAGRGTVLAVQRFQAEVRKNQSEKLIVRQEIVEVENRINFIVNRFPQPVERTSVGFYDLNIHALSAGVPAQLLENRLDVRQAERELAAAGLDVKVARANFFPTLAITSGVGYQAFNLKYIFMPEALIANVAGELVAPLINKKAIQASYLTANAKQLESVYNYQRVILNAYTEVINRLSKVENLRKSIAIKKQQLESLEASVKSASDLFQNARVEYIEVLFAQRDLLEARVVLIDTKREQLAAIVNAYQALGGGSAMLCPTQNQQPGAPDLQQQPPPRKEKISPLARWRQHFHHE